MRGVCAGSLLAFEAQWTRAAAAAAADGVPKVMNPGFVGDRTTNDIIVFIDTSAGRESARISNLQLTVPYRIGIIVYQGFFELYLGCKL